MSDRKVQDPGQARTLPAQPAQAAPAGPGLPVTVQMLGRHQEYMMEVIRSGDNAVLQRQVNAVNNMFTRIVAMEELLMEKIGLTKDDLANQVATVIDRNDGYVPSTGPVKENDRVRLEVRTRTADQTEWQGASRLQVDAIGTGRTLGKEIEGAVIGMQVGETKEIDFGKDASLKASVTVNRISAQPPKPEVKEEAPAEAPAAEAAPAETPAAPTEAPNADQNAG